MHNPGSVVIAVNGVLMRPETVPGIGLSKISDRHDWRRGSSVERGSNYGFRVYDLARIAGIVALSAITFVAVIMC